MSKESRELKKYEHEEKKALKARQREKVRRMRHEEGDRYEVNPDLVRKPVKGFSISIFFMSILVFIGLNIFNIYLSSNATYGYKPNNIYYISTFLHILAILVVIAGIVLAKVLGKRAYRVWKRAYKFAQQSPEFTEEQVEHMNISRGKSAFEWIGTFISVIMVAVVGTLSVLGLYCCFSALAQGISYEAATAEFSYQLYGGGTVSVFLENTNKGLDNSEAPVSIKDSYTVQTNTVDGVKNYAITGKNKSAQNINKKILYAHGSNTSKTMTSAQWSFIGQIADKTGMTVWVPDYCNGDNMTTATAVKNLKTVYDRLASAISAENVYILADDIGASYTMDLISELHGDASAMPGKVVFSSPLLQENTLNNISGKDPQIDKDSVKTNYPDWKGVDLYKYDFKNFPETLILASSGDLFAQDVNELRSKFDENGVEYKFLEYKNLLHNWVVYDVNSFPEVNQADNDIASFFKDGNDN